MSDPVTLSVAAVATALQLWFHPVVPCDAPPGTVVVSVVHTGGDGQPVALSMPPGDFVLRGYHIEVGSTGINPAHCGTTEYLTVTGTQP